MKIRVFSIIGMLLVLICSTAKGQEPELVTLVEKDWAFQESQKERSMSDPEAIRDLSQRIRLLAADLEIAIPETAAPEINTTVLESMTESQRLAMYRKLRWQLRDMALQNPLLKDTPLVFMKRERFVCQMLHEYVGYFYENTGTYGGDVCILTNPGRSLEIKNLTSGKLPQGAFTTLSLSHDAKTLYFAFCEVGSFEGKPQNVTWSQLGNHDFHHHTLDFLARPDGKFHLYSMSVDGSSLRQLTDDIYDDFDACELPDGDLAFLSSRRGGFIRCNNIWEPLPVYTLHRMDKDDGNIRTLSYHETNEWHPALLQDGRIVYSRWDYVDRSAAHYHGLWTSSPDGTQAAVLFGSYTQQVSACYQPKAIPGSQKILFVAGAHHANTGGSLVILDPSKTAYQSRTAEDTLSSLERLTPEVAFPETPNQWPQTYYHSPWPLSENYYFVSYSREPLGCFGAGSDVTGRTGLYYFDRFGNLELLYEDADISCQYPIPLAPRPVPTGIPDRRDASLGEVGEFHLQNVHNSFKPLPDNRKITELRVFEIIPKWPDWTANSPRLGHANAEGGRRLLGSVPVHDDGSAYFQVPANIPVYFQAVDDEGKAVQTMRSDVYLQPGEQRSCIGCHEAPHSSPLTLVTGRNAPFEASLPDKPQQLVPGPQGSNPLYFPELIQPILDRSCVSCHDGDVQAGKGKTDLRGASTGHFSQSYGSLRPFLRWYEWGGESIQQTTTLPGRCGADESPLTAILDDSNHSNHVKLTDAEKRTIYLWLDANAMFYGDFALIPKE